MKKRNKKLKIIEALTNCGAILIRSNKHEVWKLTNGKVFTIGKTPGDRNAEKVQLRLLNKLLQ